MGVYRPIEVAVGHKQGAGRCPNPRAVARGFCHFAIGKIGVGDRDRGRRYPNASTVGAAVTDLSVHEVKPSDSHVRISVDYYMPKEWEGGTGVGGMAAVGGRREAWEGHEVKSRASGTRERSGGYGWDWGWGVGLGLGWRGGGPDYSPPCTLSIQHRAS